MADQRRDDGDDFGGKGPALPKPAPSAAPAAANASPGKAPPRPPPGKGPPRKGGPAKPGQKQPPGKKPMTEFQEAQLNSQFDGRISPQDGELLGQAREAVDRRVPTAEELDALERQYEGQTPAPAIVSADLFRNLVAPVQSWEGFRDQRVYRVVINQFAVENNPRYRTQDGSKPHVFVCDVMKAMNVELPLFGRALKPNTLEDVLFWLQQHSIDFGWIKVRADRALASVAEGKPVIATASTKGKLLAVVRPEMSPEGLPVVSSAGAQPAHQMTVLQLFGTTPVAYYVHE